MCSVAYVTLWNVQVNFSCVRFAGTFRHIKSDSGSNPLSAIIVSMILG